MALEEYRRKRRFDRTAEPAGRVAAPDGRLYVVQKHAASRLHYDVRLELEGVLKSWAVPKGPSLDPAEKRLAVHVEDHPVEYGSFEGIIPKGEYGGGTVLLWDRGWWEPLGDPEQAYRDGNLKFRLHGEKLRGEWALVRMHGAGAEEDKNWLLLKKRDEEARPGSRGRFVREAPRSVATGRDLEEIAEAPGKVWSARPLDPGSLPGARRTARPASLRPQLASPVAAAPEGDGWLHEIKYDGYRILCVVEAGEATLWTRRGNDWTDRFPDVARAAAALPLGEAVYDGELVVLGRDGRPDFQALQNALRGAKGGAVAYYLFDLPYGDGYDLSRTPLSARKELLRRILELGTPANSPLKFSDHIRGHGPTVHDNACRLSLEGIVSKRADSAYEQRRTRSWLKTKCFRRQEFVVGGYTDPAGSRTGFGSLLVGYYDDAGALVFCGGVGTGFDQATLGMLHRKLRELEAAEPAFRNPPRARGLHWVRPELVAEVEFADWTDEGILRHPSFKGLREDKPPRDVVRERPLDAPAAGVRSSGAGRERSRTVGRRARGRLTHPERVVYPGEGITKRDVAEYYAEVAPWLLPHVADRPLSIVRCPDGTAGECFYQRHVAERLPPPLRSVAIDIESGREDFLALDDAEGLLALVQLGALELHPWGCRAGDPERADRLIFDLDPGPGVAWEEVVRAAFLLREHLDRVGLESFPKTSGGKGLHLVVPLTRPAPWARLRSFAKRVADEIARSEPERFVAAMTLSKRKGRIFVDYLRNGRAATCVAAYSTRARPGAAVSLPLSWEELSPRIRPDGFTISDVRSRLAHLDKDPWEGFFHVRQGLPSRGDARDQEETAGSRSKSRISGRLRKRSP
ncbi:MAG: DNA ligase D [Deltaproteobacteria bacterium]|nr:DNA ligase D [Deltaproteobacteria bacterium]